jgi:MFS-type transporter involved in bile tolerance (Atg22 family)
MAENAKASGLGVGAWVLYDLSNTVFAASILSFFFPLWVEQEVGSGGFFSGAALVNAAAAVSALFVVITAPVLGPWPTSGSGGCPT